MAEESIRSLAQSLPGVVENPDDRQARRQALLQEFCTYRVKVLMCAHHSAMFRFEDGHCIDGPCTGAQLEAVPVRWVLNSLVMEVGDEG